MEKILVTTDFSDDSKAGIRFAIQLSRQHRIRLIFLHVSEYAREPEWTDPEHNSVFAKERKKLMDRLENFILAEYAGLGIISAGYQCVMHHRYGVVNSMVDYARQHSCDYICIGTHGAGSIAKYFGTTAGALITESPIPVLCIPGDYRPRPIVSILYASDMVSFEKEMNGILKFAVPLKAGIDILHFTKGDGSEGAGTRKVPDSFSCPVRFITQPADGERTMVRLLEQAVSEYRPSVVAMFTNQERSFWELLFSPSRARELSFRTRVPLLVYPK